MLIDVAGAALLVGLVGWVSLVGLVHEVRVDAVRDLLLVLAAVLAASRAVSLLHGQIVPVVVAGAAVFVALRDWDILLGGPLRSPLGYSNATGGFFLVAAAAAAMVAVRARARPVRWGAGGLAVAFALVPWGNGTDTAAVLVLALPLAAAAGSRPVVVRRVLVAAGLAAAVAFAATVVLATTYDPGSRAGVVDRIIDASLSERRAQLWHDAVVLVRRHPLVGVGPGRFAETSPIARSDPDAAWAHNELLQLGAETGAAGLILGLALGGWGFVRLRRSPLDEGTAVAAIAFAAILVQASMDYVLHFPEVGLAVAALVGAGSANGAAATARTRTGGSGSPG